MEEQPRSFDICIVCALYEEANTVIDEFSTRCGVSFTKAYYGLDRYEYQSTTIKNTIGEPLTILVTWLPEVGPTAMAQELKILVQWFHPRFAAMTGICAGDQRQVQLGDLVIASEAYHYEEGKIIHGPDGFTHHLPATRTAGPTDQVLQYVRGFESWKKPVMKMKRLFLKRSLQATDHPKQIIAPMASGMAVRADNPFSWLQEHYHRNTVALDMEAASFYHVLRTFTYALVVKGVCDYADMTKNDAYHNYAARTSAVYLLLFIQEYVTDETMPRRDALPSESRAGLLPFHGSLSPQMKSQYQSWLSAYTATFHIPGPSGVSLPIDAAWSELQVLRGQEATAQQDIEEVLRRYHEWEPFTSRADRESYNAKDVAEIGYRVVITGGPGAGKSTLCRKLAHDLTDLEELVIWVNLPTLANRIRNGLNITTTLVDILTDSLDAPFEAREALLAQADCLIADGLDECGNLIVAVAEALQGWAKAHPFIRIVLTSRPIGYEVTYFSQWEHYSLIPLAQNQVLSSSWKLIHALIADPTIVKKKVARFQGQLESNHIVSLAARNPLLLSFLIQLSLRGESLALQRADLYEQILNLWRVSLPQSRIWQVSQLDVLLAWRSLELVGWFLLRSEKGQTACSHDQLVQQMSQQLAQEMDTRPLQASATASSCLQFWYERGVLDCFQIGHQAIYTFVHATFNEYAAGRYLARLSLSDIQAWVKNKYCDTRWREPILLAAGCGAVKVVVETLLEIDAEGEQTTSVLLFAAAALAESRDALSTLTQLVSDRLIVHLTSANPTLAYEVAEQGVPLVKKIPDLFVSRLRPLFRHAQQWTRLSALYLALEAKESLIDADEVETFLHILSANPLPRRRGRLVFTLEWGLQNKMILLAAETLARIRSDVRTKSLLQTIYENNQAISSGTQEGLRDILLDLGCDVFIEEHDQREREKNEGWSI